MASIPYRDPLPINCPRCGKQLTYIRNKGELGIYYCPDDGVVENPPDGRIRVVMG